MAYKQQYVPGNFRPEVIEDTNIPKPLPTRYGDPIYGLQGKNDIRVLIGRVGMTPVVTTNSRDQQTVTFADDPAYQKSQQMLDFEKKIASGEVQPSGLYNLNPGPSVAEKGGVPQDRNSAYQSYDPKTNIVRFYDPEGNITQEGQRTSGNIYGGGVLGSTLSGLSSGLNKISADPNFQRAVTAAAIAVVAPYATAQLASSLSGLGAYAGVTAQAITSITIQVAQGVPIEKATENALINVAVSGATGAVQQQIDKVISSDGVKNAITSTVSSGLATAAKGGSQADVEKAMTAGLVSSAASTAYKDAVDSTSTIASRTVGGAAGGAVTGGTEGAVVGGLSSAASAIASDLAADLKDKDKTVTDTTVKDGGGGGDTTVKDGGGGVGGGDTAIGELTGKDLIQLAEESAKLIGPAEPPTASLDTGVVSDAGTGPSVEVLGNIPYVAENATENIKNLVPPGYRLLTSEESLPKDVKATLLSDGSYAFIGQDTSPEYLATQELPTETIPSTGQVARIDLTAPEVVPTTPEAAAIGIGGPAPDVAPEIAVTAPSAEESATVIRVDPSIETALVINSTGDIFTVTVDPSTTAGSTVSVPAPTPEFAPQPAPEPPPVPEPAPQPVLEPAPEPVPAPIPVPVTEPVVEPVPPVPTPTPTPEPIPAPAPSPDQAILDLINPPVVEPTPAPEITPAPQPAPAPEFVPEIPPASVPAPRPMPEIVPAPEPVIRPEPQPEPAPIFVPEVEPVPVPEPVPLPSPVLEPVTDTPPSVEPVPLVPPPISERDREILDLIGPEPVAPAPAPTTVPTTAPDFATAPTTTPAPEVAPAPAPTPATDQEILDLIAENLVTTGTTTPVDAATTGTGTSTGTGDGTGVGTGTDVVAGADTGVRTGTGTTNVSDVSDTDQPILDLIAERPTATDVVAPGDVPATPGKTPITEPPVTAIGPAPVEVDTYIPRVDVYGVGNVPAEPVPTPEAIDVPAVEEIVPEDTSTTVTDAPPISDADQEILDLISEELATDTTTEEEAAAPDGTERGAYLPDSGTDTTTTTTRPDIFTTTYLSPKKRTTSSTSALGSALGTTGLTASRGAGEIEAPSTGKARKKVWNEESLKLKDALGV